VREAAVLQGEGARAAGRRAGGLGEAHGAAGTRRRPAARYAGAGRRRHGSSEARRAPASAAPPPDDPRYLQVVARDSGEEWELQLSRGTLLSGTVEVEFNNRFAEDPHDLWIRRGGTTYAFDEVASGQAASRQVALVAGTWKLWCNIPGHEQQGMVAHVTVSDG
jgi:hypothetical protein